MKYQEFLDITGCTESKLNEADYDDLVQPLIADRYDLFPIASAVATHYDRFGIRGFDEEFIETIVNLSEALRQARLVSRDYSVPFKRLLTSAEELSL